MKDIEINFFKKSEEKLKFKLKKLKQTYENELIKARNENMLLRKEKEQVELKEKLKSDNVNTENTENNEIIYIEGNTSTNKATSNKNTKN